MKNTIKKQASYFNPYFFNGLQIENIKFFDKSGVLFSVKWFTDSGSNNKYPEIELPEDIKRKNKIIFDKDVFFYVKGRDNYDLYLPINKINHSFTGEKLHYKTDTHTHYYSTVEIELLSVKEMHRINKETDKLEYYLSEKKPHLIEVRYNYRSEQTKLGNKIQRIKEKANQHLGIHGKLSSYQIEELIKLKIIK